MDLEPVKSVRIYEDIVRQVKAPIADGHLKSGERLPPERDRGRARHGWTGSAPDHAARAKTGPRERVPAKAP
jgi:hypothetical protein